MSGISSIQNILGITPSTTPTTSVTPTAATSVQPTIASDQWQATAAAMPNAQNVPLYYLFNDPARPPHPLNQKLLQRLNWFGIDTSEEYLKAASTPFKRSMISMLAGVFLAENDRKYIKYQINAWASQADLLRTGSDLNTTRLMQVSGVIDTPTLARYGNPIDKGVLYAAMAANSLQYGYHMPSFGEVSSAVERAKLLPPKVYWY